MEYHEMLLKAIENPDSIDRTILKFPESKRLEFLLNIGVSFLRRFERKHSANDLEYLIKTMEQALELAKESSQISRALNNLSLGLWYRFKNAGSMEDLERAISLSEKSVQLTPTGEFKHAQRLANLANMFQTRFEQTGSIHDLNDAVTKHEHAIRMVPKAHKDLAIFLNHLANALWCRFERMGLLKDLERIVSIDEEIVLLLQNEDTDIAFHYHNLGIALQCQFDRTQLTDHINRAIIANEQALSLTTKNHPKYAKYLNSLSNKLRKRFHHTGLMSDLDSAIAKSEEVLALTPDKQGERGTYLNNLGVGLCMRFERTGSMKDLKDSIIAFERAVTATSTTQSDHAKYLSNVGIGLWMLFERTGSIEDLDRAISTNEHAVELIPDDHPDFPKLLNSLSNGLRTRFERNGSMMDVNRAIATSKEAVMLIPPDDASRSPYLNNLSLGFWSRFQRTKAIADLENSIKASEQAVALIAVENLDCPMYKNNLGNGLQTRYQVTGSMEDLNRAIAIRKENVKLTPEDHPDFTLYCNNLGLSLQSLAKHSNSIDDLNYAIEMHEKGIYLTPEDHPDLARQLDNLATALWSRFLQAGSIQDFERFIEMKERAVGILTAPPLFRIFAADSASQVLFIWDPKRALPLLRTAIKLLPMLSPRTLEQTDQQYNIAQFTGIAARAASASLECGEAPETALQILELGRGVIASFLLEVRSDVSILRTAHPDIGKEFDGLRSRLDSPKERIQNFGMLSLQFDALLQKIRALPRFEQFLLGPSVMELKELAEDGAIVVFNVSQVRSDAFIIEKHGIRCIRLPLLRYSALKENSTRFLNTVQEVKLQVYSKANREVKKVLEWLWDVAVEPVLNSLGYIQRPAGNETWPKVWWVGSGLLSVLPIHAAGYHDSNPPRAAIDLVISSYTPTVKALAYAREHIGKIQTSRQRMMLVGMPITPDHADLPHVNNEIETLRTLMSDSSIIKSPTRETVLSGMNDHSIIHLACHGSSSVQDPSQSKLLLTDWKVAPLTVSDITSQNLQSSQFAYLSACHTASARDLRLLDESIHLASAIQLAGFPSVIATLWKVQDQHSAGVAKDVYTWMLKHGPGDYFDTTKSAEALHWAVLRVREETKITPGFSKKSPSDPLTWAPYVHFGV